MGHQAGACPADCGGGDLPPDVVESFNGRTGVVFPVAGDYSSSQVIDDSGVGGANVAASLDILDGKVFDAQADATQALADAAFAIGVGNAAQADATQALNDAAAAQATADAAVVADGGTLTNGNLADTFVTGLFDAEGAGAVLVPTVPFPNSSTDAASTAFVSNNFATSTALANGLAAKVDATNGTATGLTLSGTATVAGGSTIALDGAAAVRVPTVAFPDSDTSAASTAFVSTNFAPIDSPLFTGDPRAPTPTVTDDDTSLATTAFVYDALDYYTETARRIVLVDEFSAGTVTGQLGWTATGNGAGNLVIPNNSSLAGAKGFMTLNAGTSAATGRAALSFEQTAAQLPFATPWVDGLITIEWRPQLFAAPVAVTADYEPSFSLGQGAATAAIGFASGVGVFCTGANANWIFASRNATTTVASVNTGVTVVAGAWMYFRIEIDAVSARLYHGTTKATAVLVATIAIASVTTLVQLGPMAKTVNIAGGVARNVWVDYMRLIHTLTTSR